MKLFKRKCKTFEDMLQETIKPNWKWKLLSITNNRGNKQTQFKMSDFGHPYDIVKNGDVYRFKLPTSNGDEVIGYGMKLFVE